MATGRVDIGNAIIAGIASSDNALDQTVQIIANLEHAGFAIVSKPAVSICVTCGKPAVGRCKSAPQKQEG
jgi:hypothetical protein